MDQVMECVQAGWKWERHSLEHRRQDSHVPDPYSVPIANGWSFVQCSVAMSLEATEKPELSVSGESTIVFIESRLLWTPADSENQGT